MNLVSNYTAFLFLLLMFNSSIYFIFLNFLTLCLFLLVFLSFLNADTWIISRGFYQTKNVEHKGQVFLAFHYFDICD